MANRFDAAQNFNNYYSSAGAPSSSISQPIQYHPASAPSMPVPSANLPPLPTVPQVLPMPQPSYPMHVPMGYPATLPPVQVQHNPYVVPQQVQRMPQAYPSTIQPGGSAATAFGQTEMLRNLLRGLGVDESELQGSYHDLMVLARSRMGGIP